MKEIIRDDKKFYEIKEQDLIRLHTRLRLIYECVDVIFTDYEDFDPSTIAALTDIKNQVTEARDILAVDASADCRVDIKSKHPNCNVKANIFGYKVEISEEDWQKIRAGAMTCGDVEQRLETVKSSLEDAIADVDCTLGDRIDEQDEKIAEMYEFYQNFPADWTLEKQLKELAEDRLDKFEKNVNDMIRKTSCAFNKGFDERLKLLSKNVQSIYDDVASLRENVNNANITANVACNNPRIEKLEKELNGINAVQGGHRLELDGLNRKLDQIRVDVNKNKRALIILKENVSKLNAEECVKEYMSATLEETTDESVEDRLDKLEKQMNNVITDIAYLRKALMLC